MRKRVGASRILIPVVGVLTVVAYAGLMTLQALVLDPLAAVPGTTLKEIHTHLEQQGFDVAGDIRSVVSSAIIGIILALAVAIWSLLSRLPTVIVSTLLLMLIVLGAPITFGTGFALGMDVADAYGVDGGSHTIWAGVLYLSSLAGLASIVLILVMTWINGNRRQAVPA